MYVNNKGHRSQKVKTYRENVFNEWNMKYDPDVVSFFLYYSV